MRCGKRWHARDVLVPDSPTLVVLDTGVVIGALGNRRGLPARVLLFVVESGVGLVSDQLTAEYRSALISPRPTRHHGLGRAAVQEFVESFVSLAREAVPSPGPDCPDRRDQHLWDLLATERQAILVTGEAALLDSNHFPGRILSPRDFVERYLDAD